MNRADAIKILNRIYYPVVLVLSAIVLNGCATITTGETQSITIDTLPPGATCTLTRDGQTLGVVESTPGSITVDKSEKFIDTRCSKEGYQEVSSAITPGAQGMTAGNILFGGIIGLMVDAGSGAAHQYPEEVLIALVPIRFASEEERDAFYEKIRTEVLARYDESRERITSECKDDACQEQLKQLEATKQKRLAELERRRDLARIGDADAATDRSTREGTYHVGLSLLLTGPEVGERRALYSGAHGDFARALYDTAQERPDLRLVVAYDRYPPLTDLPVLQFLPANQQVQLWSGTSRSAHPRPVVERIAPLCDQYGLDIMLAYHLFVDSGMDELEYFLVDCATGQVYYEKDVTFGFYSEGYGSIKAKTAKLLNRYLAESN